MFLDAKESLSRCMAQFDTLDGGVMDWIDGFGLYHTSPTVDLILSLISSTVAS